MPACPLLDELVSDRGAPATQEPTDQRACTWYGALPGAGTTGPRSDSVPQIRCRKNTRMPGSRSYTEVPGPQPSYTTTLNRGGAWPG